MAVFILHISNINPPPAKKVQQLFDNHQNGQDTVLVKRSDDRLDGGFAIARVDDTAQNVLNRDSEARMGLDHRSLKNLATEARVKKAGAFSSRDRSITSGEKPLKERIVNGDLR